MKVDNPRDQLVQELIQTISVTREGDPATDGLRFRAARALEKLILGEEEKNASK